MALLISLCVLGMSAQVQLDCCWWGFNLTTGLFFNCVFVYLRSLTFWWIRVILFATMHHIQVHSEWPLFFPNRCCDLTGGIVLQMRLRQWENAAALCEVMFGEINRWKMNAKGIDWNVQCFSPQLLHYLTSNPRMLIYFISFICKRNILSRKK